MAGVCGVGIKEGRKEGRKPKSDQLVGSAAAPHDEKHQGHLELEEEVATAAEAEAANPIVVSRAKTTKIHKKIKILRVQPYIIPI